MVIASLLSAACIGIGFFVFTISTLTPFDNIGVMTMKMMSITSIMSTIGVTLISATGGGALCCIITLIDSFSSNSGSAEPEPIQLAKGTALLPDARALRPLQEVVDQLRA